MATFMQAVIEKKNSFIAMGVLGISGYVVSFLARPLFAEYSRSESLRWYHNLFGEPTGSAWDPRGWLSPFVAGTGSGLGYNHYDVVLPFLTAGLAIVLAMLQVLVSWLWSSNKQPMLVRGRRRRPVSDLSVEDGNGNELIQVVTQENAANNGMVCYPGKTVGGKKVIACEGEGEQKGFFWIFNAEPKRIKDKQPCQCPNASALSSPSTAVVSRKQKLD